MSSGEESLGEVDDRQSITEVFEGMRRKEAAAFALVRPALRAALLETADTPEPVDVIALVAEQTGVTDEVLVQNALFYLPGAGWVGDRFRIVDQETA